jgi:hypothetical protein
VPGSSAADAFQPQHQFVAQMPVEKTITLDSIKYRQHFDHVSIYKLLKNNTTLWSQLLNIKIKWRRGSSVNIVNKLQQKSLIYHTHSMLGICMPCCSTWELEQRTTPW